MQGQRAATGSEAAEGVKQQMKNQGQIQQKSEASTSTETKTKTQVESESQTKTETQAQIQTGTEAQAQSGTQAASTSEADLDSMSMSELQAMAKSQLKTQQKVEVEESSESEAMTETQIALFAQQQSESLDKPGAQEAPISGGQQLESVQATQIDDKIQMTQEASTDEAQSKETKNGINPSAEDEAVFAFSQAMVNGVKVMDLPEAQQAPQMDDSQAMMEFQEHVNELNTDKPKAAPAPKRSAMEQKIEDISNILQAQFQDDVVKPVKKDIPTEAQAEAQNALDEVAIVIPDGMSVRSHKDQDDTAGQKGAGEEKGQAEPDTYIQKTQESIETKKTQEMLQKTSAIVPKSQLNDVQSEAQAAIEYISVKDPNTVEVKVEKAKPQKEKIPDHLLEQGDQDLPKQAGDQSAIQTGGDQLVQPVDPQLTKVKEKEIEQIKSNAMAAQEVVTVKQVSEIKPSAEEVAQKAAQEAELKKQKNPIQPKTFSKEKAPSVKENEVDRQIRIAEEKQMDKTDIDMQQGDKLESQITGSGGLWDSSMEMEHMTGKLVNPQDYRSKAQIEKDRKEADKKLKMQIRDEILQPESVSSDDTNVYSGYLALQSSQSKSQVEIDSDKAKAAQDQKNKEDEDKKRLAEIQEQNKKYQEQLEKEEKDQIHNANMIRVQRKNDLDMADVQDLKALEKLQRGSSNNQIQGLTDQAELDEKQNQEEAQIETQMSAIKDQLKPVAPKDQDLSTKVSELSKKLGVPSMPGDNKLASKEQVATVMVQRAVKAGKTESQITAAMTS